MHGVMSVSLGKSRSEALGPSRRVPACSRSQTIV